MTVTISLLYDAILRINDGCSSVVPVGVPDGAGDADPAAAGGGRHHLPDAAHPAPSGHPADPHPEHGQHLQLHPGHPADQRGRLPQTGQWHRCSLSFSYAHLFFGHLTDALIQSD